MNEQKNLKSKQRLLEVMSRLDKTFKPKLNENMTHGLIRSANTLDELDKILEEYSITKGDLMNIAYNGNTSNVDSALPADIWNDLEPYGGKYYFVMDYNDNTVGGELVHLGEKILGIKTNWNEKIRDNTTDEINERKNTDINPKYTHFAVLKSDNKIVNGWDYHDIEQAELNQFKKDYFFNDIADMDINTKLVAVYTKRTLESKGINPFDTNNWYKFEAEGWRDKNELNEKQFKPESYYNTLSEALDSVVQMAESRGYTVDNDEIFRQFGTGGVGYGETKRGNITLYKEGNEQRKALQIIIYRMDSGKYELTTYIN